MLKKIILIIGIVFIVSLITGCTDTGDPYIDFDPYVGYEGLRVSFLDNAPPYEIMEEESIPIGLLVENKGAYDVRDGVITFSYEKDYMTEPQGESNVIELRGKSAAIQTGEFENKLFYSKSKPLDRLSRVHDVQLMATACYEYQTLYTDNICIDTDYFNVMDQKKACEREDLYPGSQGAPVAVTEVSQILTDNSNNVTFDIKVENVGGGELFDYFSVSDICGSGSYLKDKYNQVRIEGSVSTSKLTCDKYITKLNEDGEGKFICWFMKVPGTESGSIGDYAFNSVINLKLYYGYISTISTEIHIEGNE